MKDLLEQIKLPSDLQKFKLQELEELSDICRNRIIQVISKIGGHLASSLGTVELTIAMFHVFNADEDYFIWDVGHQAYTHKLLTGRNSYFETLGKQGGIAKFLRRKESKYDHFGAGHASTSISASLGIKTARDLQDCSGKVVSVIGDGAMTGGLAFEAMNHAGHLNKNLIVILNDNDMSIDRNVGALSKTFTRFQSSKAYNRIRKELARHEKDGKLSSMIVNTFRRVNDSFMALLTPGVWFEKLGFRYFGPIDGHNLKELIALFQQTKNIEGPILLHVLTKKGKGYSHAEGNSIKYHGVGAFEPNSGSFFKKSQKGKAYTAIWSQTFHSILKQDFKVVATSAAMLGNTGLSDLQKEFPKQIFDVGIAEGHAVTFSAGMATQGLKPFVVIYSTFLQRALDHIIHDVALQNLPVRFVLDRAGFVGPDGPTHHGQFDLTYLRMIPNMVIMAPKNGMELQQMLYTAYLYDQGPIAIRFPKGNTYQYIQNLKSPIIPIPFGKAELICSGEDILLIAVGNMVDIAEEICTYLQKEGVSCGVINARFVKPLDKKMILSEGNKVKLIATLEENIKEGGFGSGILELLHSNNLLVPVKQFGIEAFIEGATTEEQRISSKIDSISIFKALKEYFFKHCVTDKMNFYSHPTNKPHQKIKAL